MKKLITTAIVILSVGIAMILVGSILKGITWSADFNGADLASALNNIGYIAATLSGIVLAGLGVATAIKGCNKDDKNDKNTKE